MNKQPLFILFICFILGIIFQENILLSQKYIYILLIISFLALFLALAKNYFLIKLKPILIWIFFFLIGTFCHSLSFKSHTLPDFQKKEILVFKLNKKLNSNEKNRRYEISIFKTNTPIQSVLSVPKSEKELDFYHFYKAELFINKVEKPTNNYQFDYQKYLSRKDIFYQSYLPNSYNIAQNPHPDFADKVREQRLEILQKINQSSLQINTKDFLKGLILADRTEMNETVTQDFTKSGLVHFLAISGTHMVVIFWFLMLILKPLFPVKYRKIPIIFCLILIWSFAIFIDYGNSVMRSCLMITAYYIYVLLQRKPDLLHSLALAGFIILIFDSHQLFDVGFQLSFLAVFGIFWLNQPILKLLPKHKNTVIKFLFSVFSVTISAQIITLPLILYYFHQFSLISIISNLFIVPLSEIIIVLSLLMTITIGYIGNFTILNSVYDFIIIWLLKTIHYFAEINLVYFDKISVSLLELGVLFLSIYFLRGALVKKDFKNYLRFGYVILLLFLVRISLNFISFNKKEAIIHTYFKDKIFSVKENGEIYFWLKKECNLNKVQKSIIEPYLVSERTKKYQINYIPINSNFVEFKGKTYNLK